VLLAYVPLAVWFVMTGRIGGSTGIVPGGTRTGALGASYLGYPLWAMRVGRRLRGGAKATGGARREAGSPLTTGAR
jgi:hypothetical protein